MPERIEIPCPGCQRDLSVREQYLGRMIQCKHCGERFVARSKHKEEPHVIPWPEVALKALGVGPEESAGAPASPPREPGAGPGQAPAAIEGLGNEVRAKNEGNEGRPSPELDAARQAIADLERERERLASELAAASRSLHSLTIEQDYARAQHQRETEALQREREAHAASLAVALAERDGART